MDENMLEISDQENFDLELQDKELDDINVGLESLFEMINSFESLENILTETKNEKLTEREIKLINLSLESFNSILEDKEKIILTSSESQISLEVIDHVVNKLLMMIKNFFDFIIKKVMEFISRFTVASKILVRKLEKIKKDLDLLTDKLKDDNSKILPNKYLFLNDREISLSQIKQPIIRIQKQFKDFNDSIIKGMNEDYFNIYNKLLEIAKGNESTRDESENFDFYFINDFLRRLSSKDFLEKNFKVDNGYTLIFHNFPGDFRIDARMEYESASFRIGIENVKHRDADPIKPFAIGEMKNVIDVFITNLNNTNFKEITENLENQNKKMQSKLNVINFLDIDSFHARKHRDVIKAYIQSVTFSLNYIRAIEKYKFGLIKDITSSMEQSSKLYMKK